MILSAVPALNLFFIRRLFLTGLCIFGILVLELCCMEAGTDKGTPIAPRMTPPSFNFLQPQQRQASFAFEEKVFAQLCRMQPRAAHTTPLMKFIKEWHQRLVDAAVASIKDPKILAHVNIFIGALIVNILGWWKSKEHYHADLSFFSGVESLILQFQIIIVDFLSRKGDTVAYLRIVRVAEELSRPLNRAISWAQLSMYHGIVDSCVIGDGPIPKTNVPRSARPAAIGLSGAVVQGMIDDEVVQLQPSMSLTLLIDQFVRGVHNSMEFLEVAYAKSRKIFSSKKMQDTKFQDQYFQGIFGHGSFALRLSRLLYPPNEVASPTAKAQVCLNDLVLMLHEFASEFGTLEDQTVHLITFFNNLDPATLELIDAVECIAAFTDGILLFICLPRLISRYLEVLNSFSSNFLEPLFADYTFMKINFATFISDVGEAHYLPAIPFSTCDALASAVGGGLAGAQGSREKQRKQQVELRRYCSLVQAQIAELRRKKASHDRKFAALVNSGVFKGCQEQRMTLRNTNLGVDQGSLKQLKNNCQRLTRKLEGSKSKLCRLRLYIRYIYIYIYK